MVALTPAEKECLVLSLIWLVAFVVQSNEQSISPLRQYRCHHAARISEATYQRLLQFSGWDRDGAYINTKRDFREARQFFGNDCLPITSITSDGEELVDYVLYLRMSPVSKRNPNKYPQQKGELLCSTYEKPRTRRISKRLQWVISRLVRIDVLLIYSHFIRKDKNLPLPMGWARRQLRKRCVLQRNKPSSLLTNFKKGSKVDGKAIHRKFRKQWA